MQDAVAQVYPAGDLYAVHLGEAVRDLAGQVRPVHAHTNRQVFGGRIQLMQIVVALIEVVAHFFMRHGDGSAAAAIGVAVLGRRGQLRRRDSIAPVQIDHRAGQRGVPGDHVGDLGRVDVDIQVFVLHYLA